MSPRRSHAFSLIEIMVVVAVLGVLVAILMPAIGFARESSRRSQCRNRLSQLGLALHNYHDSHKVFPSGIVGQNFGPNDSQMCQFVAVSPTCDNPRFAKASGLTQILPFMEQRSVYLAYNQQLASCALENHTAVSTTVRGFVCPSNPREFAAVELSYYLAPPNARRGAGPTDYVFSMGGNGMFTCINPFAISTCCGMAGIPGIMKRGAGPFNVNSSTSLDKFKDGSANTLLMGESVGGAELYIGLVGKYIAEGGKPMNSASTRNFSDNAWSQGWIGSENGGSIQGFGSVFAATAWNAWYDPMGKLTDPANGANWLPYPINEAQLRFNRPTWAANSRPSVDITGTNGAALPSGLGSVQGFRSYHPNIAQFLMGDGSVRSISESVDARVLVGFSSLVGREPVEAGQ